MPQRSPARTPRKNPVEDRSTGAEWISVGRAAKLLGIAEATVLTRGFLKEIEITTFAGRVFVNRQSVDRLLTPAS